MSLVKWTFIGLLVLPAAEIVGFLLVAAWIGWLWAGILFVATSVLGVMALKRSGRRDLARLADALRTEGISALRIDAPGIATMLGAVLLIIPGLSRISWAERCSFRHCDGGWPQRSRERPTSVTSRATISATGDRSPTLSTSSPANGIRLWTAAAQPDANQPDARRRVGRRAGQRVGRDLLVRPEALC